MHKISRSLCWRVSASASASRHQPALARHDCRYVCPNERATPLAIFALGINIGLLIAFLVGGWVNHHYGWRTRFQVVALPGLFLAVVAMFTLRDPPRGLSDGHEAQKAPPLGEVALHPAQ